MQRWKEYYEQLLNEEFDWNKDSIGGIGDWHWWHWYPVQSDQINNVNKEKKILKQASNQTDDTELSENKNCEEIGNSSQQGEQPWIRAGRSGTHSLSPPSKHDKRGQGQRGKAGEPPDKQFRGSQSPRKSVNTTKKTTEDRSLGAVASGGHSGAQVARHKIDYP